MLHGYFECQFTRLRNRFRQLDELVQDAVCIFSGRPAACSGQGALAGRAIEVIAGLHDPQIDSLGTRQWVDVSLVEIGLKQMDTVDQLADESQRVFSEGNILSVGSAPWGLETDREDHRPHAHDPQGIGTLDNYDSVACQAAIVNILDQSQYAVLLGLGFFVPYDRR